MIGAGLEMIGGWDHASHAEAMAAPGNDPRQWISNGVVNADAPNAPSVSFASKIGPLVSVRLHPSDIDVRCRVASFIAGGSQGEWHPFVGGDEVVVALPMGSERSNPIIIGRCCNGVDAFPTNVANNDVTQNNVTARKTIPNFAWEVSNGWLLRSVTTKAQLALDVTGQWTVNSGDLHFLQLGSRGVVLSLANMTSYLTLDAATGQLTINCGPNKCRLTLDPSTGVIYVGSSGTIPVGHTATAEGVVNMVGCALQSFTAALVVALGTGAIPLTATALAALITPLAAAIAPIVATAVAQAAAGGAPLVPYAASAGAVTAALAVPRDPTGLINPGLGAAGVVV